MGHIFAYEWLVFLVFIHEKAFMLSSERLLCVQLIPLTLSLSRKMDGDETNGNMFIIAEEVSDCGRTGWLLEMECLQS